MESAKLIELLGGKERFAVLQAVYLGGDRWLTNQQVADLARIPRGNAHRFLSRWAKLGLLSRREDGRNITYRASDDPALAGLRDLLVRGSVLLDDIRAALPASVDTAVVFGSVARSEERAGSDIDILALGDGLSSIKVNAALKPVGRKHQRDINATCLSAAEFAKLLKAGDGFATSVASQRTIPIKGDFRIGEEGVSGRRRRTSASVQG
jgi:Nucleotidyltransferase domain